MAACMTEGPQKNGKHVEIAIADDSSESETEPEPAKRFHRRISTNREIKSSACTKEGHLMKQTNFQRWKRRYFKLKGRKLYYAKDTKSVIFDEIELTDLSVAECSTKNINHSFQVITPFRNLVLCADSRREMEEWISALKTATNREFYDGNASQREMMSGQHNWYACSHARPTYCNVCREALSGVTSHGLSCEVCKFKAHKRCAVKAQSNCKWTTLAAIGQDILEDEDGLISMPHQWLEGNLPVSAKCYVCDKTCGSVLKLQDWRCLWCKTMVHTSCKDQISRVCPLGQCKLSILPPTAINNIDSDGYWEATRPPRTSPLLVFVNTKSGDNQGVKFLRRFKQLLNPAQVFDLMNGGPHPGLRLFQRFDQFRILVCGGDGSVGWVLSEIDKLDLHKQCQMGVLPFGTGNDLARVLGWGSTFDADTQLPVILEKLEHSQIKMLDRWSIWTYEGTMPPPRKLSQQFDPISVYEDSVANHLSKMLHSEDHSVVISSAKVLCQTVKDFVAKVGEAHEKEGQKDSDIALKCNVLNEKLESLLGTLNEEAQASSPSQESARSPSSSEQDSSNQDRDTVPGVITAPTKTKSAIFKPRDALMSRANSLKKAIRQIIEHTERAVDEQNAQTKEQLERLKESPLYKADSSELLDVTQSASRRGLQADSETSRSAPTFSIFTLEAAPKTPLSSPRSIVKQHCFPNAATVNMDSNLNVKELDSGASRRISSMSMLNKTASAGSILGRDKSPSKEQSAPLFGVPFHTVLPGLNSNIAGKLAGGSFISKVLLANADALCAAASPLVEDDIPASEYTERCVMNNYFGIGLDAKITLDFQNKREEHPEKCRSRTKNFMWYGVLGGKELVQRSFKNLDQRVQLECDGQRIPLPSLQGIVILNIPSYMGGANFWGGKKEDDTFQAPSFDDKILEVVAVFGSVQMAMSRVIDIQHHRIAQCRRVKITIMGDESVPAQVDGEAWMQPPGYIHIVHKNRAQMLTRDRVFENTLKSWSEKQKEIERSVSPQPTSLSEEESLVLQNFVEVASALIKCVKIASLNYSAVEQELFPLATQASEYMDRLFPAGKLAELHHRPIKFKSKAKPTLRSQVIDFVRSVQHLNHDTNLFLTDKAAVVRLSPDISERLNVSLSHLELELQKICQVCGINSTFQYDPSQIAHSHDELIPLEQKRKPGKLRQVYSKLKGRSKDKHYIPLSYNVYNWTPEDVGQWLESRSLAEYKDSFIRNEIRGTELLTLDKGDLQDLGVTKVGHLKRIQQGIKELNSRMTAYDKSLVFDKNSS
ncbi:diacylglycerol kinase delta-like isoform X3 [Ostrea edulis]|uniref:diacylglycerol kinase delta-like isoform X3 n=1 Tax=Ostrea edulis TaxID=37623 RepID=UPI0024AF96F0|nr:diacylglycerol kinase delta-like isoform X3 [Ostrea edulis]